MYDAIIVGARCAGSATGMLLARKGRRVLVVDRATFPSDSVPPAGNIVAPGAFLLRQWGLLDRLVEAGCPPVRSTVIHLADGMFEIPAARAGGVEAMYVARHSVLDTLLAEEAAACGAEVRLGVRVIGLIEDGGRVVGIRARAADGTTVEERAPIVIGADGRYSYVARAVGAGLHHERTAGQCCYYGLWAGVPTDRIELFVAERRVAIVFPTHNDEKWVILARPRDEWEAFKAEPEAECLRQVALFPDLAQLLAHAVRVSRLYGAADLHGFYRQCVGPGWALVGDAGHAKDPGPGRGISDAFCQADMLAAAVDQALSTGSWTESLAQYERRRDETTFDIYQATHDMADYPPLAEMPQLLARIAAGEQQELERLIAEHGLNTVGVGQ